MAIPQAMAFAMVAGLAPVVGLYAASVPIIAYALFGSSRQLVVGPVAVVSFLVLDALKSFDSGSPDRLLAAAVLALLVGSVYLVAGLARLGGVANLLAAPVLVGFVFAVVLIVGVGQVGDLIGVSVSPHDTFLETLVATALAIPDMHSLTAYVGVVAIIALVVMGRIAPRWPGVVTVAVSATVVANVYGFADRGVASVGEVPAGVPVAKIPSTTIEMVSELMPAALVIALVGFAQSVAIGKVYSSKNGYRLIPNRELMGLGAANIASGLFGGYPVSGSLSRTVANDAVGASSRAAGVVASLTVSIGLMSFVPGLADLPRVVLSAIVIVTVLGLVDIKAMAVIARAKRSDATVLLTSLFATLTFGAQWGLVAGVAWSLVATVIRIYRAGLAARMAASIGSAIHPEPGSGSGLGPSSSDGTMPVIPASVGLVRAPFTLCFLTVPLTRNRIRSSVGRLDPNGDGRQIVLNMSSTIDIDITGTKMLESVSAELNDNGVELHLVGVAPGVASVLRHGDLFTTPRCRVHRSVEEAMGILHSSGRLSA